MATIGLLNVQCANKTKKFMKLESSTPGKRQKNLQKVIFNFLLDVIGFLTFLRNQLFLIMAYKL